MKVDMVMPQMGESIAEGTIVKWRKNVGDLVEKDELILEISTDKVDSEIPAPASGKLVEILAEEGKTVNVGAAIARIDTNSNGQAVVRPAAIPAKEEAAPAVNIPISAENISIAMDSTSREAGERPKKFLSPLVRRIAKENGILLSALDSLPGSGANGRITKSDILDYIARQQIPQPAKQPISVPSVEMPSPQPLAQPVAAKGDLIEVIPMDHVRKRIAEHMVISKHTAPHVTSVAEVDLTRIVNYREKVKDAFEQREGVKLTFTAFFVSAAARALKEYPLINSSVEGDNILQKKLINIGFAVGMDRGLIVPVIKGADQLNLLGIARALTDLSNRARGKQLKPEEVQGGTFSITNIGTFGNLFGTPIINQPQVAILGTGAIKKRPVVIDDAIAIRSMAYISLTYDHRIIDGLYGGSFLQRIVQILENFELGK